MKVTHAGRQITVEVTSDGEGLVSHAGSALLASVADATGLTAALSGALSDPGLRAGSHDRGRVVRDLAVTLADGGDCLADLRAVGDQDALFGAVASTSTAFRVIDRIASTPGLLDALRDAHARARARVWELAGAPERVTIDLDGTLLTAHCDKENAEPTYKRGYGFHPMLAYADETGEVEFPRFGGHLMAERLARPERMSVMPKIPPYSEEFKREAVALMRSSVRSVS
jgi:hypothetical protein